MAQGKTKAQSKTKARRLDEHILELLAEHGEMHTNDIIATMPDEVHTLKKRLYLLKKDGQIDMPAKSLYVLTPTSRKKFINDRLKRISKMLRVPEHNQVTVDKLMNIYDRVLDNYETWIHENVDDKIDYEKQQFFLEHLRWLTAIADKLLKRWSIEYQGYDTNTRQAQEDAKLKTAEKEKAALAEAPLEEQLQIVGHFHSDMKVLWEDLPEPGTEPELEPETQPETEPETQPETELELEPELEPEPEPEN